MHRNLGGLLSAVAMIFAATGCNLVLNRGAAGDGTIDALAKTALYQTAAVKSQSAALQSIEAPPPTATSTLQPTPTFTPTITLTPTLEKVTVSVSKNTNCRTGPDKFFDLVGIMKVGETAEAVARNAEKTYWVIRLPANTAKECWLWWEWAALKGNGDALPIRESPPTPTWSPKPDYTMLYIGITFCAPQYAMTIQVTNAGNVPFESIRIKIYDTVTDEWHVHQLDGFRWYNGCGLGGNTSTLVPGATANVSAINPGQFSYNPAGHLLNVYVRICTDNGLGGSCMDGSFNITPS